MLEGESKIEGHFSERRTGTELRAKAGPPQTVGKILSSKAGGKNENISVERYKVFSSEEKDRKRDLDCYDLDLVS